MTAKGLIQNRYREELMNKKNVTFSVFRKILLIKMNAMRYKQYDLHPLHGPSSKQRVEHGGSLLTYPEHWMNSHYYTSAYVLLLEHSPALQTILSPFANSNADNKAFML